jgi:hypothetical protein
MPDNSVEPDRGRPEMKWKVWDVMAPLGIGQLIGQLLTSRNDERNLLPNQ